MGDISNYIPNELFKIVQQVCAEDNSRAYLVGGAVRDAFLDIRCTDFDIEIYNIPIDELLKRLANYGKIHAVGKSFGVIKLISPTGMNYDFSLPRIDSKRSQGHKGFEIKCDPSLSPKDAASRRDFTINALMYDLKKYQLLDFYGGLNDLNNRILRHIGKSFSDDPLRVLRGMQFAGRFSLHPAPETVSICRENFSTYNELSLDRIRDEWLKWATQSKSPSLGILFLESTNWIQAYPEIYILRKCPQDPIWHPEGDVLTHTLMACDNLAQQTDWKTLDFQTRASLMFAILCHDFGKPDTLSYEIKDGRERIRAKGHNMAGIPHVKNFLANIGLPIAMQKRIIPLVINHLFDFENTSTTSSAVRRLSVRLQPENIQNLERINFADRTARGNVNPMSFSEWKRKTKYVFKLAQELNVSQKSPSPILDGNIIMKETGLPQGPQIGFIIKKAFNAQLDGKFNDIVSGLKWLKKNLKNLDS